MGFVREAPLNVYLKSRLESIVIIIIIWHINSSNHSEDGAKTSRQHENRTGIHAPAQCQPIQLSFS